MAISYITSDGTIRHDLTGDTFGIPSITQATADAITSKPVGLIANIDGSLNKWSGTVWEKQLKETDLPQNHPTQIGLVTVDLEDVATVIEPEIPVAGTEISFKHPSKFGSWTNPLSTLTISLAFAKQCSIIAYVEAGTIPIRINEAENDDILFTGDAFDTTVGTVNKLTLSYTEEVFPQNHFIQVHNVKKVVSGVDPALIGFWEFEEGLDNRISMIDSSPYANNGTNIDVANTTREVGIVGDQVRMISDGSSGRFVVPHDISMDFSTGITVMAWVTIVTGKTASTCGIMSKDKGTAQGFEFYMESTGIFRFNLNQSTTSSRVRSVSTVVADVPQHLAVTYDNTSVKIYFNGALEATTAFATPMLQGTDDLYVCGLDSLGFKAGNKMDQVRLFTRALSDAEVLAIYTAEAP